MVFFTGANATPSLQDLTYHGYHQAAQAAFELDTNITAATLKGANINLDFAGQAGSVPAGLPMFLTGQAAKWTVSGRVQAPAPTFWNAPGSFAGELVLGSKTNRPVNFGPGDIITTAVGGWSYARLVNQLYAGPLAQLQRVSDSRQLDIYPNSAGELDRNAFSIFCYGETCNWSVLYDQIGTTNFTQATPASQPAAVLQAALLGNRPAGLWTEQGPEAMTAGPSAAVNDIFATAGYISVVTAQTGNANQADRILYKSNGGTVGWEYHCGFIGTSRVFNQNTLVSVGSQIGTWTTVSLGTGGFVEDAEYSAASLANVPSLNVNGTNKNTAATQPIGTITSDSAWPLLLGNNAATGGSRGFPGYIAEVLIWKTTPTATELESIRRNQAVFYGVASVQ
jgi:hypothetical protein